MKTYSQFEEDLFLLDFFKKKDAKNNFFFEFGAWDGVYLSNCRLLFENNWSGCFVELDKTKFSELKKNANHGICITTGTNEYGPAEDAHMVIDHLVSAYLTRLINEK